MAPTKARTISVKESTLGWGMGIDWSNNNLKKVPDPTSAFSLLCIFIMVLRHYQRHDDLQATMLGFFLDPHLLICYLCACAVRYKAGTAAAHSNLTVHDSWAGEWYWWNAWLFNMSMDGLCGTFQKIPVVLNAYQQLDHRFTSRHPVPWTVGLIELTCHGPLCFYSYYLIVKNDPLRFPVELVTASFQLFGMLVFLISELYEEQVNIPAHDPVGVEGDMWANLNFNEYHLTNYWFGFWFCELVWFFVPLVRLYRAFQECKERLKEKSD